MRVVTLSAYRLSASRTSSPSKAGTVIGTMPNSTGIGHCDAEIWKLNPIIRSDPTATSTKRNEFTEAMRGVTGFLA